MRKPIHRKYGEEGGRSKGQDRWVSVLKEVFPKLFKIASNRNAIVANLWMAREEEGTLSLLFKRHVQDWEVGVVIQFTEFIHKVRVQEARENGLLWGAEKKGTFLVLSPTKEIWGTCAPMKTSSFPWDAKWGKILTIDVLNQMKMVNYQQMLANHILIHCKGYGQKKEEDVEYGFSLLVLVCSVKETKGSSMGRAL
ncbi:hypothetical protein CK203_088577 [Vitis vinifera]|uniref:Uncharacterized protein n=1 Tax=Vitis vinifera TaxID=29760 RepID=A0A438F2F2_VITVI|nr:hypothetical protein CK203_088577 [Vitis vinifera]